MESHRGPQQGLDTTFRRTWDNAISRLDGSLLAVDLGLQRPHVVVNACELDSEIFAELINAFVHNVYSSVTVNSLQSYQARQKGDAP